MKRKIVYFLGAGASRPFGIPLTRDLLPMILQSIEEKDLFWEIDEYDFSSRQRRKMERDLRDFLYRLMPGLEYCYKAFRREEPGAVLPLITDILSIVDHLTVNSNRPFVFEKQNILYYRNLLDRAIFEILADENNISTEDKARLKIFLKIIQKHYSKGEEVTFITTNYDSTFEYKVYEKLKIVDKIDFGFSWRYAFNDGREEERICYQPKATKIRIFKLHGSLNWLKCDLCDHIYINPGGNIIHQSFRNIVDDYNSCHCGNGPLKSIIVAPSFEREVKDANLLHIWKSSVQALRDADELIMIGYSLPSEDLAIKSLLIRGKNIRKKPLKKSNFTVVQHGENSRSTYEMMFGKENFTYLNGGLEQFLSIKSQT
jgi:NAD-dependent SIR2 family protein deacetylase